jgi:hypothetical protein
MFGKIGRNTSATSGMNPLRADNLGGLIISKGDYKDMTLGRKHYFAFCQSQNVAKWNATAAIGLILYNPPASGVNCVLYKWSAVVWAASIGMTGMVLSIATQATEPTTTTAATLTGQTLLTGSVGLVPGSAIAYSVATILTPVIAWPLFHNTVTIALTGAEKMNGDLKGAIGIAPGTAIVMGALGAAGVTVDLGLTWEEVPATL